MFVLYQEGGLLKPSTNLVREGFEKIANFGTLAKLALITLPPPRPFET